MQDAAELMERMLDFNLAYVTLLVEDVDDDQMAANPGPGVENHPAFTIGHLVMAAARTRTMLGDEMNVPEGWDVLFDRRGPSDRRLPVDGPYPSKAELLAELSRQHELIKARLADATESQLADAVVWRLSDYLPTTRDAAAFMVISHASMHLGQLAAWRRAMGLPAALGRPA